MVIGKSECGHWQKCVWLLAKVGVVIGKSGCGHWLNWVWSLAKVGVVRI